MSFTMGTLAMLLTLTLACIQSAMLFNKFFELSALNRCTFDAQVSAEDPAAVSYTHLDVYKRQLIQIVKKASERGNLPGNADFAVCHCLTCILAFVNFQIILKFLNICGTKIFHNIKGNVTERRIFQSGICG